jgi:hypothetical protein
LLYGNGVTRISLPVRGSTQGLQPTNTKWKSALINRKMATMWTSSEDNPRSDKAPADPYSSDNRQFAIQQWEEAVFAVEQSLIPPGISIAFAMRTGSANPLTPVA